MGAGRREFVQVLVIGGAGIAAFGCGDEGGTGRAPSCSESGGTAKSISANHGHKLAIPAADFSSGTDHTYSIMGTADHDHEITLTAAQLAEILAGSQVQVTSTETNIHPHIVMTACGTSGNPGGGGPYDGGY
jgi:hypothetical protein